MAHEIYNLNGADCFTRRAMTAPAWHGLGGETPEDAPLEVWARNAGMQFEVKASPVMYGDDGFMLKAHNRNVLYRSDNREPLAVVSDRYHVVQPSEILEFFRDITEAGGFRMETAGVLGTGGKYWALASNGQEANLSGDVLKPYLLLATACDGTMATTATFTSVRVVCQNTLSFADSKATDAIRIRHNKKFDADEVKANLGIETTWSEFMSKVESMASRSISADDSLNVVRKVFGVSDEDEISTRMKNKINNVIDLFSGQGYGSDLSTARGTRWGLLNAITQYVDHTGSSRNQSRRIDSAWFGQGAKMKDEAFRLLAA